MWAEPVTLVAGVVVTTVVRAEPVTLVAGVVVTTVVRAEPVTAPKMVVWWSPGWYCHLHRLL